MEKYYPQGMIQSDLGLDESLTDVPTVDVYSPSFVQFDRWMTGRLKQLVRQYQSARKVPDRNDRESGLHDK